MKEHASPEVRIPLRSGGHCVGYLTLLAPTDANSRTIEERMEPLDAVLATVVSATMAGISMVEGLLNGPAFRTRIDSETARAQRHQSELSTLHIRLLRHETTSDCAPQRGWTRAMRIGKALVSRLRDSDAVGVIAPDHLAILFPATDRLGARIALKRVAQLLTDVHDTGSDEMGFDLHIKSFPEDGTDNDDLCSDLAPGGATERAMPQSVTS